MKRSELLDQIEAYLALNVHVADETAEGLKFLRLAYMQLRNPSDSDAEAAALRADLTSADQTIAALNDKNTEYSDVLYDLLLQTGLLPEIDGEPVLTFEMALKEDPDCVEKLTNTITGSASDESQADKDRFINAVRKMLDGEGLSLLGLWETLEKKAQYLEGLEKGIQERDQQISDADERIEHVETLERIIVNCFKATGVDGDISIEAIRKQPVYLLEERIQRLREKASGNETPADDTAINGTAQGDDFLEHIVEEVVAIVGLDWQDVETLPQHVQKLAFAAKQSQQIVTNHVAGHAGWVTDAIDLAHAVRGNLAPENRVMAKAAEQIIMNAPKGEA